MPHDNNNVCIECFYTPNYHSFHLLSETDDHYYFYTCPSETKIYNDPDGLVKHIRLYIENINKQWTWIFNAEDFGFKHAKCKTLHSEVMNLLSEYAPSLLKNIIIINQNLKFKAYLSTCWYYIPTHLRRKIIFDVKNNFSSLLKLDDKLRKLHYNLSY